MSTVLFWFRNDLRLHDQPALRAALTSGATHLLPVVCLPAPDESTPWGFARVGAHRRAFTSAALRGLQRQMSALGNPLLICQAPPAKARVHSLRAQPAVRAAQAAIVEKHGSRQFRDGGSPQARTQARARHATQHPQQQTLDF